MKSGKAWGQTELVMRLGNVEIHRIAVKRGGYCSKHFHQHKVNMFFVERGQLVVDVWKNDYELCDRTHLNEGESLAVYPGEYHQFRTDAGCVAYEIYWTELDAADIVRDSCGGVAQQP